MPLRRIACSLLSSAMWMNEAIVRRLARGPEFPGYSPVSLFPRFRFFEFLAIPKCSRIRGIMTKRVVATMVMITNNPEITVITSSIHIDIVFHSRLKAAADASLRSA
jgi:hypothetical protein